MRVGGAQMFVASRPRLAVRIKQSFLEIQRGIHQPLRDGEAMEFGKPFSSRRQPRQQIKGVRQNNHVVRHFLFTLAAFLPREQRLPDAVGFVYNSTVGVRGVFALRG